MHTTLVRKQTGLKIDVQEDGLTLVNEIAKMCPGYTSHHDLTDADFAKITAEALMNYKIMLERTQENCKIVFKQENGKEYSLPFHPLNLN